MTVPNLSFLVCIQIRQYYSICSTVSIKSATIKCIKCTAIITHGNMMIMCNVNCQGSATEIIAGLDPLTCVEWGGLGLQA